MLLPETTEITLGQLTKLREVTKSESVNTSFILDLVIVGSRVIMYQSCTSICTVTITIAVIILI